MSTDNDPGAPTWRDYLTARGIKVHPAAATFDMLEGDELAEMARDIAEHGLRDGYGVALWTPEQKPHGRRRPRPEENWLIDGQNRCAAIALAFPDPDQRSAAFDMAVGLMRWAPGFVSIARPRQLYGDTDPKAYVILANILRRHLKPERKRELIADLLKAHPEKSDRQIAVTVKASPTTVGAVRAGLEKSGDVSKLDTRADTKGRQQPATKPPIIHKNLSVRTRQIDPNTKETSIQGDDGVYRPIVRVTEVHRNPQIRDPMRATRAIPEEARTTVITHLATLLQLDPDRTLNALVTAAQDAREFTAAVPKEKRVAIARGFHRALGLTDADFRPLE